MQKKDCPERRNLLKQDSLFLCVWPRTQYPDNDSSETAVKYQKTGQLFFVRMDAHLTSGQ